MKPEIAALMNARHYLQKALACVDSALEDAAPAPLVPEHLLREPGAQTVFAEVSRATFTALLASERTLPELIAEANARGDEQAVRRLLLEQLLIKRRLSGVPLDGK